MKHFGRDIYLGPDARFVTEPESYFEKWHGELWFEVFHICKVDYQQAEDFSIANIKEIRNNRAMLRHVETIVLMSKKNK